MRRLVPLIALLCLAIAALPAPAAVAKKKKAKTPTIKLVSPMRVAVGRTLTIRGKNFSSNRRKNTIVFRSPGKRTAFAKPKRASRTKLVVKVPGSVERLLRKKGTKRVATRFSLRVVTKRYGKLTPRRRSPVIVSATETGDLNCGKGADFDSDLLSNAREKALGTDPCLRDTDGDGVADYFEVESALDLNQRAVPYPGKRPFPNALDPSDSGYDYDGDALSNKEEHDIWAKSPQNPAASLLQSYTADLDAPGFGGPYGTRPTYGGRSATLNYSDGKQATVNVTPGHPEYRSYLDDGDLRLTDDERDADGDGLRNVDEIRALMWEKHYPAGDDCGYEYKPVLKRVFLQVNYLDHDSDGDGVWDGNDDQDTDGVSNVDEVLPPYNYPPHVVFDACQEVAPLPVDRARNGSTVMWNGMIGMRRHPYNPCLPARSATCHRYGLRG
jgi:IPT/TIG domain